MNWKTKFGGMVLAVVLSGCGGDPLPPPRMSLDDLPTPAAPTSAPVASAAPSTPSAPVPATNAAPAVAVNPAPAAPAPPARTTTIANASPAATPANNTSPTQPKRPVDNSPDVADIAGDIENFKAIGAALGAYAQQHGKLPAPFSSSASGAPLLSWRVHLLPLLGMNELYARFKLNEPWDSPHNSLLSSEMPAVFGSSPDGTTRYLMPKGTEEKPAAADALGEGKAFIDGGPNTILLLHVPRHQASVWTQPDVYQLQNFQADRQDLFANRAEFAVMWGDGTIGKITSATSEQDLHAALTLRGGETFRASNICEELTDPVADLQAWLRPGFAPKKPAAVATNGPKPSGTAGSMVANEVRGAVSNAPTSPEANPLSEQVGTRLPVPDEAAQKAATELVKELYKTRYEKARREDERRQLARDMLTEAEQMKEDQAGYFVLQKTALNIAIQAGDTATARQAVRALVAQYEIDDFEMRVSLLKKLAEVTTNSTQYDRETLKEALELIQKAVARDDYPTALELHQVALAEARRSRNRDEVNEMARIKREIDEAAAAYTKVTQLLASTNARSSDAATSHAVGIYYCVMKDDWSKGLPYLAASDQSVWRRLAETDLAAPATGEEQLALADGWWELGESEKPPRSQILKLRAGFWYLAAAKQLPAGLARLKAENRIKELQREYGSRLAGRE